MDKVTICDAVAEVLVFMRQTERDALVRRLDDQGIYAAADLTVVSEGSLERSLTDKADFSISEISHTLSVRNWVLRGNVSGSRGDQRDSSRPRRSRSPGDRRGKSKGKGKGKGKDRHRNDRDDRGRRDRDDRGRGDRNDRGGRDRDDRGGARRDQRAKSPEKPPLWAAVEKGDEEQVKDLLLGSVDIEEKFKGWTPLMKAAEEDKVEILQLLLDSKADVEVANRKGRTALSFAAGPSMGRPTACQTLRVLLNAGADAARKDDTGMTPKKRATKEKRDDALEILAEFDY